MYFVKTYFKNAKKQSYNGYIYMSKFEAGYAVELDMRLKSGDIKAWERQVKIPLVVNGFFICNYYVDFLVHHNDGNTEYVETKGYATDVWKLKWKLFEALYSEKATLTVIMQGKTKPPKARRMKI